MWNLDLLCLCLVSFSSLLFFFIPRSFSQFLHLPFFLPLFLLSPSILVLSLLELFKQVPPLLSSPTKSTPTSACSSSAWTHVSALVLDSHLGSPWLWLQLHGTRPRHCYHRESFTSASGESRCECEGEVEECGEVVGCQRRRHRMGFQLDRKPLSLLTFSSLSLYLGRVCYICFGFFINFKRDNMGLW